MEFTGRYSQRTSNEASFGHPFTPNNSSGSHHNAAISPTMGSYSSDTNDQESHRPPLAPFLGFVLTGFPPPVPAVTIPFTPPIHPSNSNVARISIRNPSENSSAFQHNSSHVNRYHGSSPNPGHSTEPYHHNASSFVGPSSPENVRDYDTQLSFLPRQSIINPTTAHSHEALRFANSSAVASIAGVPWEPFFAYAPDHKTHRRPQDVRLPAKQGDVTLETYPPDGLSTQGQASNMTPLTVITLQPPSSKGSLQPVDHGGVHSESQRNHEQHSLPTNSATSFISNNSSVKRMPYEWLSSARNTDQSRLRPGNPPVGAQVASDRPKNAPLDPPHAAQTIQIAGVPANNHSSQRLKPADLALCYAPGFVDHPHDAGSPGYQPILQQQWSPQPWDPNHPQQNAYAAYGLLHPAFQAFPGSWLSPRNVPHPMQPPCQPAQLACPQPVQSPYRPIQPAPAHPTSSGYPELPPLTLANYQARHGYAPEPPPAPTALRQKLALQSPKPAPPSPATPLSPPPQAYPSPPPEPPRLALNYEEYNHTITLFKITDPLLSTHPISASEWIRRKIATTNPPTYQTQPHESPGFITGATHTHFLVLPSARSLHSTTLGFHMHPTTRPAPWDPALDLEATQIQWTTYMHRPSAPALVHLLVQWKDQGLLAEEAIWTPHLPPLQRRWHRAYYLAATGRELKNLLNRAIPWGEVLAREKEDREAREEVVRVVRVQDELESEGSDGGLDGGDGDAGWDGEAGDGEEVVYGEDVGMSGV